MATHDEAQASTAKDKRKARRAGAGLVLLAFALAAAGGTAFLLTRYMDARITAARVPTTRVVVAASEIPVATAIRAEALKVIEWPAVARPEGTIADPAALVGRITLATIATNEPILPSKLASPNARSGLASLVASGMRAAAVRVDDVVGVAGFVHPGDKVDVLVTMKPTNEASFMTRVLLQNVQVLAVGKQLEARQGEREKAAPVTVATLLVSPDESERLALAASKGQILLTLRGLGDEDLVATSGATPRELFAGELAAPPPAAVVKAPARRPLARQVAVAPSSPPRERQVVEILRGDLFEKRDFDRAEKKP
jgi:pilus assembly protein CpaB